MRRAILLLSVASVLALTSCGGESTSSSPTPGEAGEQAATSSTDSERDRWVTYWDEARGLGVSYPSNWYRAEERLTPLLEDPKEILSLGTYPLRVGGDRCPYCCTHYPVYAVEDLGPDDAFLSVLERAAPYPAAGYPPRPARFELPTDTETNRFCVLSDARFDEWLSFSERGRAFYLLVAFGEAASEATKMELLAILNSLTFD